MKPQSFRGAKQQNKLIFQVHIAGSAGKPEATHTHAYERETLGKITN